MASPIGPLTLVAADGGLAGVYMDAQRHLPPAWAPAGRPGRTARMPRCWPRPPISWPEYFAGERTRFELPLVMDGTGFQRGVWAALREYPCGEDDLLRRAGLPDRERPGTSRAVGLANGKNPISIIVPCHRVVGSDGSLTGYGGGLDRRCGSCSRSSSGSAAGRWPSASGRAAGLPLVCGHYRTFHQVHVGAHQERAERP